MSGGRGGRKKHRLARIAAAAASVASVAAFNLWKSLTLSDYLPASSSDLLGMSIPPAATAAEGSASASESWSPLPGCPVIDVLSIGSNTRPHYLSAQARTWASHKSVRHFFNATEDGDANPDCALSMTDADVRSHNQRCKKQNTNRPNGDYFMRRFRWGFYSWGWVKKQGGGHPAGWVCAQRRWGFAFGRLGEYYRRLQDEHEGDGDPLPDYLLLVDDDTLYDLDQFAEYMRSDERQNGAPRVYAGCMGRIPYYGNWSSPGGGYGTIFTRAALTRLVRPVDCTAAAASSSTSNVDDDDDASFVANFCSRLDEDLIGEGPLYKTGMSVSDLMSAYSTRDPFCLHSDWIVGYFVNYYRLSVHTNIPGFDAVDEARLHEYDGSKNCDNNGAKCLEEASPSSPRHVCHYVNDTIMHDVTVKMRAAAPDHFPRIAD